MENKKIVPMDWDEHEWNSYLSKSGFSKKYVMSRAGDGNMNLTLRFKSDSHSLIAKHSPSYCVKFPMVPAPIQRLTSEYLFYESIQKNNFLREMIPQIIQFDPIANILLMQDLGDCLDFSFLYKRNVLLDSGDMSQLLSFLNYLHDVDVSIDMNGQSSRLQNTEMKTLNHQYIFDLPFTDENFNLENLFPTRFREIQKIKKIKLLQERALEFGQLYLHEGKKLLHGDFYPLSWLKHENKIYVIDPEFCLIGKAEFDLGVLLAHLILTNQRSLSATSFSDKFHGHYERKYHQDEVNFFAAFEVIRRLIHVAQLPITITENEKMSLLEDAVAVVMDGHRWL